MQVDKLIKYNSNPYTAVRITLLHSDEELEVLKANLSDLEIGSSNRIIEIEINSKEFILFITQKDLISVVNNFKNNNIKLKIVNIIKDLFEMSNLEEFINSNEETDEEVISLVKKAFPNYMTLEEIINNMFNIHYNIDDVLDLINNKGIESLNKFNKSFLI